MSAKLILMISKALANKNTRKVILQAALIPFGIIVFLVCWIQSMINPFDDNNAGKSIKDDFTQAIVEVKKEENISNNIKDYIVRSICTSENLSKIENLKKKDIKEYLKKNFVIDNRFLEKGEIIAYIITHKISYEENIFLKFIEVIDKSEPKFLSSLSSLPLPNGKNIKSSSKEKAVLTGNRHGKVFAPTSGTIIDKVTGKTPNECYIDIRAQIDFETTIDIRLQNFLLFGSQKIGDTVKQGDYIGFQGCKDISSDEFITTIKVNGKNINPDNFLK